LNNHVEQDRMVKITLLRDHMKTQTCIGTVGQAEAYPL